MSLVARLAAWMSKGSLVSPQDISSFEEFTPEFASQALASVTSVVDSLINGPTDSVGVPTFPIATASVHRAKEGQGLALWPMIKGDDNATCSWRLWIPALIKDKDQAKQDVLLVSWMPYLEVTGTACSHVGVADTGRGTPADTSWRWCDAISIVSDRVLQPLGARIIAPRDSDGALTAADNKRCGIFLDKLAVPFFAIEPGAVSAGSSKASRIAWRGL